MTLEDFTPRRNQPFSMGVLLAANAVADARVLVDGPDCSFFRARTLAGTHDARSTLLATDGRHRLAHTGLHVDTAVAGHEAVFRETLARLRRDPGAAVVFVTALPMAVLTGIDHRRLVAEVEAADPDGAPVVLLAERSLDEDWLDGWGRALAGLAETLDVSRARPAPDAVALVGHLMDRGEADQTANGAELRRLLEGIGLTVASLWLDGGPRAQLDAARDAALVVALPHGRRAGPVLGRRLGVPVVEAELPFGPDATDRFVRAVAAATGRAAEAEAFVAREHALLADRWRALLPERLAHRVVGFEGDPALVRGFVELAGVFGMRVARLVAGGRRRPGLAEGLEGLPALRTELAWEPRTGLRAADDDPSSGAGFDLYVGHGLARLPRAAGAERPCPFVELGFPSPGWHACHDAPFLGYRGALCFVDRLANALSGP